MRLRPGARTDYATFLRLFPELGVDDPVPPQATWERELLPGTYFLEEPGDAVPLAYAWMYRFGPVAHVRHFVTDPAQRGRGVGTALMKELAKELQHLGCTRWFLNVKAENEPAVKLYRKFGFVEKFTSTVVRFPWAGVGRLPVPQRQTEARQVVPGEEAALENAFRLPSGLLGTFRSQGNCVVMRLLLTDDRREPRVGLARFSPAFPGAYPFRVASVDLARPLLESLQPHALPAHADLQLVTEDHPALARALVEAGGQVKFEILQMDGEIPRS